MVVLAACTALGGLVALLAGAYGLRQKRRLAAAGQIAVALVKPTRPGLNRPLLQFGTADGRVVEVVSPRPPGRWPPLTPGGHVRLAYDIENPREIMLLGRERLGLDHAFVAAGAILVVCGIALGVAWT